MESDPDDIKVLESDVNFSLTAPHPLCMTVARLANALRAEHGVCVAREIGGSLDVGAMRYCKTSYIQSAEQLSCKCLIEQAGPGEADKTLSLQARGGE